MGDPVWLPEVLRAAGLRVETHKPHDDCGGYLYNGHGDFGDIWGAMFHHTGSYGETERGIAHHPSLGLCSQCLVKPDGTWVVCGVGIAYHAGRGIYPGIARDWGNGVLIGVEVAHDGGGSESRARSLPHRALWDDEQYSSVVVGFAAILTYLGRDASRGIGHREYAGVQGKWDPGNIDLDAWRADVAATMRNGKFQSPKEDDMGWLDEKFTNFKKNPNLNYRDWFWHTDKNLSEVKEQLFGPDGKGWRDLFGVSKYAKGDDAGRGKYLVEAVADMGNDIAEIKRLLTEKKP